MVDIGFLDKLSIIYNFLKTKSMILLLIMLIIVIILDLLYGRNSKTTKTLYISIIFLLLVYILMSYYKPLLNIFDIYIENIFKLSYFPSIIDYITILLITIIYQIFSIKKLNGFQKHINIWTAIIIEALFIINVIALTNIKVDLTNITSIYENNLLLSIFQTTGIIFVLWILFNVIVGIIKLFIKNEIEMPKLNNYYE